MPSPNEYQVGGNHYKCTFEHWDWVDINGLGYLEGTATKYLCRWPNKGRLEDLKKARHYTMKLIERATKNGRTNPCDGTLNSEFGEFAVANSLGSLESTACFILAYWSSVTQLRDAVNVINTIILNHFPEEFNKETP
jgi:hypothetical protein